MARFSVGRIPGGIRCRRYNDLENAAIEREQLQLRSRRYITLIVTNGLRRIK